MDNYFFSFSIGTTSPNGQIDLYGKLQEALEFVVKERDELRKTVMEDIRRGSGTDNPPEKEDR